MQKYIHLSAHRIHRTFLFLQKNEVLINGLFKFV